MKSELSIAVLQMCSSAHVEENLKSIETQLTQLDCSTIDWLVLPEYFPFMGLKDRDKLSITEPMNQGMIQEHLRDWSKRFGLWIFAGSMPITSPDPKRPYGRMMVFDDHGECQCYYDKIHLFDVQVADGHGNYMESKGTHPGSLPVVCDTPWGRVGLAICYDLRFPELFQYYATQDVDFYVLPAAFTHKTGAAHWQVLLQARAIENQSFMIAAAQGGTHQNGRQTWGHSMVVDCWGTIVGELAEEPGSLVVKLSLRQIQSVRRNMPVRQHRVL